MPGGEPPWIVSGDPGQIAGPQNIDVYLRPTIANAMVRRGLVIPIRRGTRPVPTEWVIQRTAENYAQVAVEGRNFNDIQGPQDLNRPFRITGRFEDEELVSLATVLRSAWNTGDLRVPRLPILSAEKRGDTTAFVSLRAGNMEWYWVTLRRQGASWIITEVRLGVA